MHGRALNGTMIEKVDAVRISAHSDATRSPRSAPSPEMVSEVSPSFKDGSPPSQSILPTELSKKLMGTAEGCLC
jgi:hypothetical protein